MPTVVQYRLRIVIGFNWKTRRENPKWMESTTTLKKSIYELAALQRSSRSIGVKDEGCCCNSGVQLHSTPDWPLALWLVEWVAFFETPQWKWVDLLQEKKRRTTSVSAKPKRMVEAPGWWFFFQFTSNSDFFSITTVMHLRAKLFNLGGLGLGSALCLWRAVRLHNGIFPPPTPTWITISGRRKIVPARTLYEQIHTHTHTRSHTWWNQG